MKLYEIIQIHIGNGFVADSISEVDLMSEGKFYSVQIPEGVTIYQNETKSKLVLFMRYGDLQERSDQMDLIDSLISVT